MGIVQVEGLFIETPFTNSRLKLRIVELALEVYIAKAVTEAPGLDYDENFIMKCKYNSITNVLMNSTFKLTKNLSSNKNAEPCNRKAVRRVVSRRLSL